MQCLAWSCAAEMHHVARSARSIPIPAAADRTPAPETAPAGRLFSGQCAGNTAEQGNRPKTPVSGGSPRSRSAQSRSKRLFQPKGTYRLCFSAPPTRQCQRRGAMKWTGHHAAIPVFPTRVIRSPKKFLTARTRHTPTSSLRAFAHFCRNRQARPPPAAGENPVKILSA